MAQNTKKDWVIRTFQLLNATSILSINCLLWYRLTTSRYANNRLDHPLSTHLIPYEQLLCHLFGWGCRMYPVVYNQNNQKWDFEIWHGFDNNIKNNEKSDCQRKVQLTCRRSNWVLNNFGDIIIDVHLQKHRARDSKKSNVGLFEIACAFLWRAPPSARKSEFDGFSREVSWDLFLVQRFEAPVAQWESLVKFIQN